MGSSSISLIDLYLLTPALCLLVPSILILLVNLFSNKERLASFSATFLASGSLLATATLSSSIYGSFEQQEMLALNGKLLFNPFSYWMTLILTFSALLSLLLFSRSKIAVKKTYPEFVFLFLNSVLGALVIVWSNDLLTLFLGIELMSLSLYTKILISKKSDYSRESAVKYYILGGVSSAFFLLGMIFIYGSTSFQYGNQVLLNISQIKEVHKSLIQIDHLFLLGSTFMFLASLLKLGLFPFHNWIPDVYEGAETSLTYYMITVVKFGAISVVLKLLQMGFLQDSFYLKAFTQWLVVLSLLFGSLIALKQKSLKRILAYSGVAQSGFMLIPILGLGFDGVGYVDQMIFYMFTYALFSAFIFSVITGIEHYKGADLVLSDLRGLNRLWPLGAMAILIGVVGLSGLPPLIGAVTKFFVLYASIQTGFYWVAFWALISSIVSMAYYLNFIHEAYFSDERLIDKALWDRPMEEKKLTVVSKIIILILLSASISLIYIYPFF